MALGVKIRDESLQLRVISSEVHFGDRSHSETTVGVRAGMQGLPGSLPLQEAQEKVWPRDSFLPSEGAAFQKKFEDMTIIALSYSES